MTSAACRPGTLTKLIHSAARAIGRIADKWTMIVLEVRTVHAVVPPRVEYRLTGLGAELSEAVCGAGRFRRLSYPTLK